MVKAIKKHMIDILDYDYDLPEEYIAQSPKEKRDEAKLMVLNKKTGEIEHKIFKDIIEYLNEGDVLVLNDTKVIPARIMGTKSTGAKVEIVLIKEIDKNIWEAMVRPGNKLKQGAVVYAGDEKELEIEILDILPEGLRKVELKYDGILNEVLDKVGVMPLPPYITEELKDNEMYQTIYAKFSGSAAAPTAGLHFTKELLDKIEKKGVKIAYVTLHVGLGTFRPVKVRDASKHNMHSEHYIITEENAKIINEAKANGGKVISVGTTSTRTLEAAADENGKISACESDTSIFIYPGYKFKIVDNLITNFHLPKSTLVMLVSALSKREYILNAYEEAKKNGYKFFSFGDAMYIHD